MLPILPIWKSSFHESVVAAFVLIYLQFNLTMYVSLQHVAVTWLKCVWNTAETAVFYFLLLVNNRLNNNISELLIGTLEWFCIASVFAYIVKQLNASYSRIEDLQYH